MDSNEDIKLLLMEEQTLLSRERTMHSYMQTGLTFTSVGLFYYEVSERPTLFLLRHSLYHSGLSSHSRSCKAVFALQEIN